MDTKLTTGTVVRLKSGGPNMTVMQDAPNDQSGVQIACSWFERTELRHGRFAQGALERITLVKESNPPA